MRILIDTCVLYPTVMREMVLGAAAFGAFEPFWSPRILEEWARAAVKLGPAGEAQARGEIALLRTRWPASEVSVKPGSDARFWLPDDDDIHVLAAAVHTSADAIMTLNAKDFPRGLLWEEGLERVDPDSFLHQVWLEHPQAMAELADRILHEALSLSDRPWDMRSLLKKARLPRLAKALNT
jgi:predicted nucleic acid-binding protein